MNDEPTVKEMAALWNVCYKFIEAKDIACPESIYQSDRVSEDATTLIEQICDIVGYVEYEDDE